MIIEPDFIDHWKTRLLVDLLSNDEMAPVYLIRLWAHCQQRKSCEFSALPMQALKAICRFPGDADLFEAAMIQSGFVERTPDFVKASGWDEYNASLIANWTNGKSGGRPKKNPPLTHGLTQTEPMANPIKTQIMIGVTDKIREDKIGEVKSKASATGSRLPDGWMPNDEDKAYFREHCKTKKISAVAENFYDYWIAKPGAAGRKLDWSATWRTWVRREAGDTGPGKAQGGDDEWKRGAI